MSHSHPSEGGKQSGNAPLASPRAGRYQSEKNPVLFLADQGEMIHAGRSRIGNESESVAIRERCHHRPRRRGRDRNPRGALNERSTHLVY